MYFLTFTRRINYKRQFVAISIFLIACAFTRIIYKVIYHKPYVVFLNDSKTNISCYYEKKGDGLPSLDENFQPPINSIFFLETSCQGGLSSRQACSVESAARAHNDRQVYILFSGAVSDYMLHYSIMAKLQEMPNVNFVRILIEQFAKATPLESLIRNRIIDTSPWWVMHATDVLKILTLYKWSGIYMDTDVLIAKNLGPLGKNWITKEDSYQVNAAAFGLSHDELAMKISEDIAREIARTYDPLLWNGPEAITRVLNNTCTSPYVDEWTDYKCAGFQVYDHYYISPVHSGDFDFDFDPNRTLDELITTSVYAYHMWNQLTEDCTIFKDSPYDKLAKKLCPTVYNVYGEEFGS